jgi:hypothetical protein
MKCEYNEVINDSDPEQFARRRIPVGGSMGFIPPAQYRQRYVLFSRLSPRLPALVKVLGRCRGEVEFFGEWFEAAEVVDRCVGGTDGANAAEDLERLAVLNPRYSLAVALFALCQLGYSHWPEGSI